MEMLQAFRAEYYQINDLLDSWDSGDVNLTVLDDRLNDLASRIAQVSIECHQSIAISNQWANGYTPTGFLSIDIGMLMILN